MDTERAFFSPVINYGFPMGSEDGNPDFQAVAWHFLDGLNINVSSRAWAYDDQGIPLSCEVFAVVSDEVRDQVIALEGVYEVPV